jgi:hypothetical protein
MPLTNEQRSALTAEANRRGIDPGKLIAAAEQSTSGPGTDVQTGEPAEKPKLYMYLLPFVTVREVRQNWLGLTESFPGDSEVASKWAAKQGGDTTTTPEVVE